MFTEKMKKALSLALFMLGVSAFAVFLQNKQVEAYLINPILPQEEPKRHRILLEVYNADNVAHEVGDVVVFYDGSLEDGLEISTTTTANNSLVAGVVADRDIPATTWGIIQTQGYHSGVTVTGSVAAGDLLCTSTTGEAARAYTVADATGTTAGQGDDFGVFAVALAADSGGVVKAFLRP